MPKTAKTTHSQLPWRYDRSPGLRALPYVTSPDGNVIDAGAVRTEDAEFIVRAVNAHDKLVEALEQIQIIVDAQGGMDRLGVAIAKALAAAKGDK